MRSQALPYLILSIPVFLLAISCHEFAHAWMAVRRGDLTPLYEGRLTLNFMAHLSLWGTLMFLIAQIGWAKPVRVNLRNLKAPKTDLIWISLAGPSANFALALLFSLLYKLAAPHIPSGAAGQSIETLLLLGVWINLVLALFNLIPVPPLDGAKIIGPLLPRPLGYWLDSLEPWGFLLVYLLFALGNFGRFLFVAAGSIYRWLL